jgi:hypothetical protein
MKLKDVGEIIAVRKLFFEDVPGKKEVLVIFGKPLKHQIIIVQYRLKE